MYIQNKPAAAFYKLLIGAISLVLEWCILAEYGIAALRLFPVWLLFITAIYYLSSALIIALSSHKFRGKNICPIVEGAIIISFYLCSGIALASSRYQFYLPALATWLAIAFCIVLPILTLLDWILFVKKGRWRIMMPFYGLALPICYAAIMIFTAEMMPDTIELLYPMEILDLRDFGLWPALQYFAVTLALTLIFGYILYIIDFTMSGKLSKHIVLPHLKVVDDDDHKTTEAHQVKTKPASVKPKHQPAVKAATIQPSETSPADLKDSDELKELEEKVEQLTEKKDKTIKTTTFVSKVDNIKSTISESPEKETEKVEATKVEITKVIIESQPKPGEPKPEELKEESKLKEQRVTPETKPVSEQAKNSTAPNSKPKPNSNKSSKSSQHTSKKPQQNPKPRKDPPKIRKF